MITANPGNLLKFNSGATWQRHNLPGQNRLAFGLKCPKANGLPFQLFFASGAGSVSWKLVNPIDPTGGSSVTMDAADLIVTNKDGGGFWVTRTALTALTNAVDCGFWEAWVTVDGTVYKSEVMHFQESTDPTPIYRIRFTNSKDKDDVLYTSFSYSQFLYTTRWAFDTPRVDRETQQEVDGNGKRTTQFSRTVVRHRLEVADVPDYAIEFLSSAVDMDGIQFEDMAGAIAVVPMRNTTFESRRQGVSLNIAVFEFDATAESFNGCQPDFITA
jgi:hypothetical protein